MFMWTISSASSDIKTLHGLGDSVLQAILDDDSDKLLDLISSHLSDTNVFFLPNISQKLPDFLSYHPSLLSVTCFFGSMNCFKLLLSLNSRADEEDSRGRISIHFASAGGSLEMLRELDQTLHPSEKVEVDPQEALYMAHPTYRAKASKNDIYNYPDTSDMTPMHYAAQFGRLEVIKYLFLKGAKLDYYRDTKYRRPIDYACLYGHVDVVRFFVENDVPLTDRHHMHPIHYACMGGDVATIEYLLSQKVDPNVMYGSFTPIIFAAQCGSLGAIKVLSKHKVSIKNHARKFSPLIEAASRGHLDVVHFLIEQGCDPNIYDSTGKSALYAAVDANQIDVVKYLLSRGALVFLDGSYQKIDNDHPEPIKPKYKLKESMKTNPFVSLDIASEEILFLLLDNIDPFLYKIEEPTEMLITYLARFQSIRILDILLKNRVILDDCTRIYCKALPYQNYEFIHALLDKPVPFDPDKHELRYELVRCADISLFKRFVDKGVKFPESYMAHLAWAAIYNYQVDILKYFLENKLITPLNNFQLTPGLNAIDRFSLINYVLSMAASVTPFWYNLPDVPKKKVITESEKKEKLIEILKLLLEYSFNFSKNELIHLPTPNLSTRAAEKLKFLLQLLVLIEGFSPGSIDFPYFPEKDVNYLLSAFDLERLPQECSLLYSKHNFSFSNSEESFRLDHFSLVAQTLYDKLQKRLKELKQIDVKNRQLTYFWE